MRRITLRGADTVPQPAGRECHNARVTDPGEADELPARTVLGPFRVVSVLGRGGMGVVCRAVAPDGGAVAVKLLQTTAFRSSSERARFEREARVRIDHPNVVRTVDAGVDHDVPWIAFELLDGESLAERLERDRLAPAEALDVFVQVAHGLAAAHARGIVHRDLKPSNLFLCAGGTVKIIDFGIARTGGDETRLTATGSVLGTPAYLSPEQANGARAIDQRTDVWSFGASLYEAIAGRSPFERSSALATMLAVMVEQAPSLGFVAPGVPASIAAIVTRCLQKKPEERFADGQALLEALLDVDPSSAPMHSVAGGEIAATSPAVAVGKSSITPGEQRVVAVLLADGVTERSSLERAVVDAGGTLVQVLGDRAIGLFGGESWEGDELERAAAAALDARGAARHVAIASGRAAFSGATGIAGAALTAAEQGCAAKLEGVAVDAASARALSSVYTVSRIDDAVYEIVDRVSGRPSSTLPPPSLPRTVGREGEVAQLATALRTVRDESRAVVVMVTGPPGIGKSHLRWELGRLLDAEEDGHDEEPFRVLSARAEPGRRGVGLGLFESMLTSYASMRAETLGWPRIHRRAPDDERREAVKHLVQDAMPAGPAATDCATFFGALLGLEVRSSAALEAARRDPRLMQDRLRLALVDFVSALTARAPVALVLEDVHWADEASLALVEELAEQLADAPALFFLTSRPELHEEHPELLLGPSSTSIALGGLTPGQVVELSRAILGGNEDLPEETLRALAERTAGNPLFVEQILFALREEDRLRSPTRELPLPLTVEAAVQSRLDHLPAEEKDLCKRAAIFERPFTPDDLAALAVNEAQRLLVSLSRRDVFASRARHGSPRVREYRFRSSLVRDVAYHLVAPALREDLHLRLAEHLAVHHDADPEEVAMHFERGSRRGEAADWYARATAVAAQLGDPPRVLRCADRALELGIPQSGWFELQMARSSALEVLARLDDQSRALDAALATASGDQERARALTDRAVLSLRGGRTDEAVRTIAEAEELARTSGDVEVLATARGQKAAILTYAGELDAAAEALAEAARLAPEDAGGLRTLLAVWRAQLAAARGDLAERRRAYEEAVRRYDEAGDVRRGAGAETNLADVYNRVGAYVDAERALRDAVDKCRRVGNKVFEGYALANLGYALTMQGRADEALAVLADALALADDAHETRLRMSVRLYRVRALLGLSPTDALDEARSVADEARESGLDGLEALALSAAAAAALAASSDRALELSTQAMALRDRLGGLEEGEAELFVTHARALRAAGEITQAEACLARGRARLAEVAAPITDPEQRRQLLEGVAAHRELMSGAPDAQR